jgi:hypothetical protein
MRTCTAFSLHSSCFMSDLLCLAVNVHDNGDLLENHAEVVMRSLLLLLYLLVGMST